MVTSPEHAEDILRRWLVWQSLGKVAIVVVTHADGGQAGTPGALMAVSASGYKAGYILGGRFDEDVVLHAQAALRFGKPTTLLYGAGSAILDVPLPGGGMIVLTIIPDAEASVIETSYHRLATRRSATLCVTASGLVAGAVHPANGSVFRYVPKLRLRIAGRGAECLALANLAKASGMDTSLQLLDAHDLQEARRSGFTEVSALRTPSSLPVLEDDPWTASLSAFHDSDWQTALLAQTLSGPAFYVGGVGTRKTYAWCCEQLRASGISDPQIARIRWPMTSIGNTLMPVASALAKIADAYNKRANQRFGSTALVLLAAGQSSRFAQGDKLLAPLTGRPLIAYSAGLLKDETVAARIAVVAPGQNQRSEALHAAGWNVVVNNAAMTGMGSSLSAGIREAGSDPKTDAAVVLLADMPYVPNQHLMELREALTPERNAVMSCLHQTRLPPAIFARSVFGTLTALTGDTGARQVFDRLDKTGTVDLAEDSGGDVDTCEDLAGLEALRSAGG